MTARKELDVVPQLKVFIASSSELEEERRRVVDILKELSIDDPAVAGRVQLLPVRCDHPGAPMPFRATGTAQDQVVEQIGRPSSCRIVVGLLWSKLGVPIESDAYRKEEGYFTGTEWELEDAAKAFDASGDKLPDIYLFKCTREPQISRQPQESNRQAGERMDAQQAKLAAFLDGWHRRYGSRPNEFETPGQFQEQLRGMLKTRILKLLEAGALDISPADGEPAESGLPLPRWTEGAPYRGLNAFESTHASIFFGRSRETQQLVGKLGDPKVRFLLVAGASGTGKSSLVAAGVLAALARNALPHSETWRAYPFKPAGVSGREGRHDPFVAMASVLKAPLKFAGDVERLAEWCRDDRGFLRERLSEATESLPHGAEWVLFIDQFEELFTRIDRPLRHAFVLCLEAITNLPRMRVLATMRSEFLHQFAQEVALNRLVTDQGTTYMISSPSRHDLYDMIVQPARMAGVEVSAELALTILHEVGAVANDAGVEIERGEAEAESSKSGVTPVSAKMDAAIALPLVEFALERLYNQYGGRGTLTVDMYREIGGISGAIEKCLEDTIGRPDVGHAGDAEAIERADKKWEQRFADLFKHLVDVNEDGVATRRAASIEDVQEYPDVWKIAQNLREARLLVTREDTVEVAHEALFKAWEPLNRWIERRKVALREWRNMEFAAAEWDRKGRPDFLPWPLERQRLFDRDTAGLGRIRTATQSLFLKSEVQRLTEELEDLDTSHERRADIGNRLSLLGDPRPGLEFKPDGTPDISRKEYWCPVPPGTVTLEEVAGTFKVKRCYIARYPVTRAQFRAFQEAEDGYRRRRWWKKFSKPELEMLPEEGCNRPATDVAWYDAIAFCRWLSARLGYEVVLPTEWQWQQAATAGSADEYPWPGPWDGRRANTTECVLNRTTSVGMYPVGASSVGALDMSGNVWEWCLNKYRDVKDEGIDDSSAERVLRGGSWYNDRPDARCAYRGGSSPYYRLASLGFRLLCSSPILDH